MSDLSTSLEKYFNGFNDVRRWDKLSEEEKNVAALKMTSYATLVIPFIAAIVYVSALAYDAIIERISNTIPESIKDSTKSVEKIGTATLMPESSTEAPKPNSNSITFMQPLVEPSESVEQPNGTKQVAAKSEDVMKSEDLTETAALMPESSTEPPKPNNDPTTPIQPLVQPSKSDEQPDDTKQVATDQEDVIKSEDLSEDENTVQTDESNEIPSDVDNDQLTEEQLLNFQDWEEENLDKENQVEKQNEVIQSASAKADKPIKYISDRTIYSREKLADMLIDEAGPIFNYRITETPDNGDCFFGAFAAGISQKLGREVTLQELRQIVGEEVEKVNKYYPTNNWIKNLLEHDFGGIDSYDDYVKGVKLDFAASKGAPIWGKERLDGVILCRHFKVNLHVTEMIPLTDTPLSKDEIIPGDEQVYPMGEKFSDHIKIALYPGHFLGLVPNSKAENPSKAATLPQQPSKSEYIREKLVDMLNNEAEPIFNHRIVETPDNDDCLFAAFAVGISQKIGREVTLQELREIVGKEVDNVNASNPEDNWIKKLLSFDLFKDTYAEYVKKIKLDYYAAKGAPVRGRTQIAGVILCRHFKVNLHVTEMIPLTENPLSKDEIATTDEIVYPKGEKFSDHIKIALYPGHFLGLVPNSKSENPSKAAT